MKKRNHVKKHYPLVNAKYTLSTNEIKLILKAITQINMDDAHFEPFEISVSEIGAFMGSEQNYQQVRNLCKSILSKPLEIPVYNDNNEIDHYRYANWFDKLHYYPKKGRIIAKFHDDMRPVLLGIKERLVRYDVRPVLQMKSAYAIRIYELMVEHKKQTKHIFTVNELRNILQVPKGYKYADFKRKVIKVAEKELIEHADIFFEFDEIKDGRRVDKLLFRIKKNQGVKYEAPKGNASGFVGELIYWNGRDWKVNSATVNEDGSVHVILQDDNGYLRAESFAADRLAMMIEAKIS
jgi:plasmid replication initiation protein